MEMISGLLAQTQPKPQSAYDTITKLCDRLKHSSMLEDRRVAVLGLKGFSREYREAVAAGGLKALIQALHRDSEDLEACRATLETLIILFIDPTDEEDFTQRTRHKKYRSPLNNSANSNNDSSIVQTTDYISLWLTDEFTQNEENINVLLELLSSASDFYVKLYSLQLLSAVISARPRRAQDVVFQAPLGISTVISVLDESREAIRNEALLVLKKLVEDHSDVQKLVAFEGTFEKLFRIIDYEGGISGGVVVEDCLELIAGLLKYNVSNQSLFRESSCIGQLSSLLDLDPKIPDQTSKSTDQSDELPQPVIWDDQVASNLGLCLEICRLFTTPGHNSTPANQLALTKSGVLINILRLVFGGITSLGVRSVALLAVADLIRSNTEIQQDFLAIDVPYIDLAVSSTTMSQPVILPVSFALLNWALLSTSIHAFELRVNASICLNAAFEDNVSAKRLFLQEQIAHYQHTPLTAYQETNGSRKTDSDTSASVNAVNGHADTKSDTGNDKKSEDDDVSFDPSILAPGTANLLSALVDYDPDARLNPYKAWFASVILINIFSDDEDDPTLHDIRDLVRTVSIGDESLGEEILSCIQAISGMLVTSLQYSDPRISIAYLMLLSVWLYDDVNAVNDFLGEPATVQALISLVTTHSGGVSHNGLVDSMAAVLLGITYDFTSKEAPFSRAQLHNLLTSTVGRDQYVLKVKKLRECSAYKDFDDEESFTSVERDSTGLPEVFLCGVYVDMIKNNFNRIQRSFDRDPNSEPNTRISLEMYDQLQLEYRKCSEDLRSLKLEMANVSSEKGKKIEALERDLAEVNEALQTLEESSKITLEEKTKLDKEFAKVTKSLKELSVKHQTLSGEHQAALNNIAAITKSLEELKVKEKKSESQFAVLKEAKEKAEAGINKMSRELMSLTKVKNESDKKNSELDKKVADLEKKLKKAMNSENDFKHYKEEAGKEIANLAELKILHERLKAEKEVSSKKLDEVAAQSHLLEEDLRESEALKEKLIEKLKSAGSQIEKHKEAKTVLEQEVSDMRKQIDLLNRELEILRKENIKLKEEVENAADLGESLELANGELEVVQAELDVEKSQHKKDLDEMKRNFATKISELEAEHAEKMKVAKTELSTELRKASESTTEDLNSKLQFAKNSHAKELVDLRTQYDSDILKLTTDHADQLKRAQNEIKSKLTEEHAKTVDSLRKQYDHSNETLQKEHQNHMSELKKKHSDEIEGTIKNLLEKHELEISTLKKKHEEFTLALQNDHVDAVAKNEKRLTDDHVSELTNLKNKHKEDLVELMKNNKDTMEQKQKELSNNMDSQIEALKDKHLSEIALAAEEHAKILADREEAFQQQLSKKEEESSNEKRKATESVEKKFKQMIVEVEERLAKAAAAERAELMKQHGEEMKTLEEKQSSKEQDNETKQNNRISELNREHDEKLEKLKTEHEEQLNSMNEKLIHGRQEVEEAKAKHQTELTEISESHEKSLSQLTKKHEKHLADRETKFKGQVAEMQENHSAELKALELKHNMRISELREEQESLINTKASQAGEESKKLREDYDLAIEKQLSEIEELNNLLKESQKTADDLKAQIRELLSQHKEEMAATKEAIEKETDSKIANQARAHNDELEKARKDCDQSLNEELSKVKKELQLHVEKATEQVKNYSAKLEQKSSEVDKMRKELSDTMVQKNKELEEARKTNDAEILELSAKHQREVRDMQKSHSEALEEKVAIKEKELEACKSQYENTIKSLKQEQKEQKKKDASEMEKKYEEEKQKAIDALKSDIENHHSNEIKLLEKRHREENEKTFKTLKEKHALDLTSRSENHKADLEKQSGSHKAMLDKQSQENEKALKELNTRHDNEKQQIELKLANIESSHSSERLDMEEKHAIALRDMEIKAKEANEKVVICQDKVEKAEKELLSAKDDLNSSERKNKELEEKIKRLEEISKQQGDSSAQHDENLMAVKKELEIALTEVSQREEAFREAQKAQKELVKKVTDSKAELENLKLVESELSKLKQENQRSGAAYSDLERKNSKTDADLEEALKRAAAIEVKLRSLEEENKSLKERVAERKPAQDVVAKSELDDMMLVLADIEETKDKYKERLKELGEEVSSDEEDEGDDDDE